MFCYIIDLNELTVLEPPIEETSSELPPDLAIFHSSKVPYLQINPIGITLAKTLLSDVSINNESWSNLQTKYGRYKDPEFSAPGFSDVLFKQMKKPDQIRDCLLSKVQDHCLQAMAIMTDLYLQGQPTGPAVIGLGHMKNTHDLLLSIRRHSALRAFNGNMHLSRPFPLKTTGTTTSADGSTRLNIITGELESHLKDLIRPDKDSLIGCLKQNTRSNNKPKRRHPDKDTELGYSSLTHDTEALSYVNGYDIRLHLLNTPLPLHWHKKQLNPSKQAILQAEITSVLETGNIVPMLALRYDPNL
uniref:Heparanase n=1 Tax=Parastrongyloides trichosuri TaxID=131310 RepID=A0A0N4ZJI1_PARTI